MVFDFSEGFKFNTNWLTKSVLNYSTGRRSASKTTSAISVAASRPEWIKKGVPVRIEIGPRDLEKGSVAMVRRDRGPKDKQFIPTEEAVSSIIDTLQSIQDTLLQRALAFRDEHTIEISEMDEFRKFFTPDNENHPEIHGGFALVHWAGGVEEEEALQKELKVFLISSEQLKSLQRLHLWE